MEKYVIVTNLVDDCGHVKVNDILGSKATFDDAKRFLKIMESNDIEYSSKNQKSINIKWSKKGDSFIKTEQQSSPYFWYYYIQKVNLLDGVDQKEFEES